jgi:exodeoxyribonuclease VII large subunit
VTICDLVADLRAATPSAAAEAAVPVLAQLRADVAVLRAGLAEAGARQVTDARAYLGDVAAGLRTVAERVTERRRAAVEARAGKLHALSPLATLARGYAVARGANGASLTRATAFAPGARFDLVVHDGVVPAMVDPSYVAPEAP